jgi:hypothetical protein
MFATTSIGSVIAHLLHGGRCQLGRCLANVWCRRNRLSLWHHAHRYVVSCFASLFSLFTPQLEAVFMTMSVGASGTVAATGIASSE